VARGGLARAVWGLTEKQGPGIREQGSEKHGYLVRCGGRGLRGGDSGCSLVRRRSGLGGQPLRFARSRAFFEG
jgi:hypothetical protein